MSKPIDNPYSKYKYNNTFDVKFRVNNGFTCVYGADVRSAKDSIEIQMPTVPPTWVNNGATWIVNNVYKCTQITNVDRPVVDDKSAIKQIFFRLFKL